MRVTLCLVLYFCSVQFCLGEEWNSFRKPTGSEIRQKTKLWGTYFYTKTAKDAGHGYELIGTDNTPIGFRLPQRERCMFALEGAGIIEKGGKSTVINVVDAKGPKQLDCKKYFQTRIKGNPKFLEIVRGMEKTRFAVIHNGAKYGLGQRDWHLVPLRSIAVYPRTIPLGTVVYIPAARGLKAKLPDGTEITHDGYFFAADTGSDIKRSHIDIFEGIKNRNPFPAMLGSTIDNKKWFAAYIIENTNIKQILLGKHKSN